MKKEAAQTAEKWDCRRIILFSGLKKSRFLLILILTEVAFFSVLFSSFPFHNKMDLFSLLFQFFSFFFFFFFSLVQLRARHSAVLSKESKPIILALTPGVHHSHVGIFCRTCSRREAMRLKEERVRMNEYPASSFFTVRGSRG